MTRATTSTTTSTPAHPTGPEASSIGQAPSGLRMLHLVRAAFSLVWVALVSTLAASPVGTDRVSTIAAVLLVAYPAWDVVATVLDARVAGRGARTGVSTLNIVLGLAATVAMAVAVVGSLGSALLVFGVWALLSGAVQLTAALRRRHTVGAQWPMIVSGALSVLAGATIFATATSATRGLSTVAGYAAFGAVWFIVSAIALTVRSRRATT